MPLCLSVVLALAALPALFAPARGQAPSEAHPPVATPGAAKPGADLLVGPGGFLYGTTPDGGPLGTGAVFRVRPDGTGYQILHGFGGADGGVPAPALLDGRDGFLYGTALLAPAGAGPDDPPVQAVVYRLQPDGSGFGTVYAFRSPLVPVSALLAPGDGFLYGTAESSGPRDTGAVYRVRPDGTGYQILHGFAGGHGADGTPPRAALLAPGDGWLYGTAPHGGTGGGGTAFRLHPEGTGFQVLHAFAAADGDGAYATRPTVGLTDGGDGSLYGVASGDVALGTPTVFRLRRDGTGFRVLRALHSTRSGGLESPLLARGDGYLYGTALGGGADHEGTVFRLRRDGTGFAFLHVFTATRETHGGPVNADGAHPTDLTDGGDGFLYGLTQMGGTGGGGGVYRLRPDGSGFGIVHAFPAPP